VRQETINLYKFHELPDEVKEKVIDKYRCLNVDYYSWWNGVVEATRQEWLEKYGIDFDPEGLSFDLYHRELRFSKGKIWVDDPSKLLYAVTQDETWARLADKEILVPYFSDSHLLIEDLRQDDLSDEDDPLVSLVKERVYSERLPDLDDWFKDLCRGFLKELDKEYDYLTSDKAVIETIEANDWEFTINGELWSP